MGVRDVSVVSLLVGVEHAHNCGGSGSHGCHQLDGQLQ